MISQSNFKLWTQHKNHSTVSVSFFLFFCFSGVFDFNFLRLCVLCQLLHIIQKLNYIISIKKRMRKILSETWKSVTQRGFYFLFFGCFVVYVTQSGIVLRVVSWQAFGTVKGWILCCCCVFFRLVFFFFDEQWICTGIHIMDSRLKTYFSAIRIKHFCKTHCKRLIIWMVNMYRDSEPLQFQNFSNE